MTISRTLAPLAAFGAVAATAAVLTSNATSPVTNATDASIVDEGQTCFTSQFSSTIFAEGTDPEVIAKVHEMIIKPLEASLNQRYYTGSRWPGSLGNPVDVTYSFPSDGLQLDGGPGNLNVLHADLNSHFTNEATWKDLFRQVFDQWEIYTGNTYTEVSDDDSFWGASGPLHGGSNRGDIRIWSRNIDGGSNTLAFNFFPGSGVGGDMVLDSSENWSSGPSLNYRFFRNVVAHENGHGMGLFHVCTTTSFRSLMNPFATTAFDGPRHDDIRGMHRLYGDYTEPNNSIGGAAFVGMLDPQDSVSLDDLSIHSGTEDDFFEVDMTSGGFISATATPVGFQYNMAQQAGNGSCPTGPVFDSENQHNLRIRVFNSVGSELGSSDTTGAGEAETITDVTIPSPGLYYVVVDSTDTFIQQSQLYDLDISTSIELPVGDLNGDCVVDSSDLGGLIGGFGTLGPFGDINNDGIVDSSDLALLIGNFGGTCDDL